MRICSKCGDAEYTTVAAAGHKTECYKHNRSCHEFNCETCGYVKEEHKLAGSICAVCGYEAEYTLVLEYEFDAQTKTYAVVRSAAK